MGQVVLERPGFEGPGLGGLGVGHEVLELPGLGIGDWVCGVGGACVCFEHERPAKIPKNIEKQKIMRGAKY